jgi:hypothetical protein
MVTVGALPYQIPGTGREIFLSDSVLSAGQAVVVRGRIQGEEEVKPGELKTKYVCIYRCEFQLPSVSHTYYC